mmetsp:Transcript_17527/g.35781  ORF Transcript_17527/g.35781 Transcript_17527/m.35781 type:complete len:182 (-) Transcript_17527:36-581(-)
MVLAFHYRTALGSAFVDDGIADDMVPFDPHSDLPADPTKRVEEAQALVLNLARALKSARGASNDLAMAGSEIRDKTDRLADLAGFVRMARRSSAGMDEPLREVRETVKVLLSDPDKVSRAEAGGLVLLWQAPTAHSGSARPAGSSGTARNADGQGVKVARVQRRCPNRSCGLSSGVLVKFL